MSWAVIQAIRSRPFFRLYARIDGLRAFSSAQNGSGDLSASPLISKLFETNLPITKAGWCGIRQSFLKQPTIDTSNVDHVIVDLCERNGNALGNAVSYVEFLRANSIPVRQELELKVIELYMKTITEGPIPFDLEAKIIGICDNMMDTCTTLSQSAASRLFTALSSTSEWRRCVAVLDKYDIKCSASTVTTFSLLVANAFWEDEPAIGWQLIYKIVGMDYAPQSISFLAYWNYCALHRDEKFNERIERMLEFIGVNDILVSRDVLDGLEMTIEDVEMKPTEIDYHGNCAGCRQALDSFELSSHEFQLLRKEFEKANMSKEMISTHSSMAEFIRFKQIVNKKNPFHYVIDGLNVSLTVQHNNLEQAKSVAQLVKHFAEQKKRVLVIGRKHVDSQWPEWQMNYIKSNAKVFLTANESDDDLYIIYAALISGDKTHFVTGDRMRTYSQRMSPAGRLLFAQWQKQRQNFLLHNGKNEQTIKLLRPPKYKQCAHKNVKQQWHVPFVDKPTEKLGRNVGAKIKWACFKYEKFDQYPSTAN